MKRIYFSDYNEDQMQNYSADSDLVKEYEKKSEKVERPIIIFTDKKKMYEHIAEFGHQARHGVQKYRALPRNEMQELIDFIDELIEEETNKPTQCLNLKFDFKDGITIDQMSEINLNGVLFKRV